MMNESGAPQDVAATEQQGSSRSHAGVFGRHSRLSVLAIVIALCLLFFATTSPRSVPSVLLIAGFVVLGAMIYAALQLLLILSGVDTRLSSGSRRGIMLTLTLLPVLLLMMQSVGQLTLRDVFALSGLFLIGSFYAARVGRSNRS